jgi:hypothetical protein
MRRKAVVWTALAVIAGGASTFATDATTAPADGVPTKISGGHETDPRDRGRPVVLVAAGLGVPEQVFREAFSHVKPAPAGEAPDPAQVQANKRALLDALGKYGVTNDRLDEVSNRYRYRPGDGNLWKHEDATIKAAITEGKVTGFVIENAGAGYTTPPEVSVPGFADVKVKVTLAFGKDLETNGSIKSVELVGAATRP